MIAISKFRVGFFVRQGIITLGGLSLIIVCVYFSFDKGHIDNLSPLFWFACFALPPLAYDIYKFLLYELKVLTVTDNGISIKYYVTKKTEFIPYNEILHFTTRRITHRQGAGMTAGYQELEIFLTNDKVITFNEDQFDNYEEVKSSIYLNRQTSYNREKHTA